MGAYEFGKVIPFLAIVSMAAIFFFLIIKRTNEKKNETFEDREN